MTKNIILIAAGIFLVNPSAYGGAAQDFKTATFRSTDVKEITGKKWYCSSEPLKNTYAGVLEYLMYSSDAFDLTSEGGKIKNIGNHVVREFEFNSDQSALIGQIRNLDSKGYALIRRSKDQLIYQWTTDSSHEMWSKLPKSDLIKGGKIWDTHVCESSEKLEAQLKKFGCSSEQVDQLIAGIKFFRASRERGNRHDQEEIIQKFLSNLTCKLHSGQATESKPQVK
jgi:hypothetical protein